MRQAERRLRILYVRDILSACVGPDRMITMSELLARLGEKGIAAERKSVYGDLRVLEQYGIRVCRARRGRFSGYFVQK